jgi:prepilin-type N-terminal cleavage/methylation domain-containing protein/prepilin-type processing-associated H-X9-DG protein
MYRLRHKGFTLIELLVVIAIIAILAAMLFPVFARARESARKIQCLSNVKNIAMAYQMYLTDYDRLMPAEHDPRVFALYEVCSSSTVSNSRRATDTNPYLKIPVILDEYIKNRDVWRCPSAIDSGSGWGINGDLGGKSWITRLEEVYGGDPWSACPFVACNPPYPPGWGGTLTDGIALFGGDHCRLGRNGVGGDSYFAPSIAPNAMREVKTAQINDPSWFFVVGEGNYPITDPETLAYPYTGRLCGANPGALACCEGNSVDWVNCSFSQECGAGMYENFSDPSTRKKYCKVPHMGGVNIGFADGHAGWFPSEVVLSKSPDDPARAGIMIPGQYEARQKRQGLIEGFQHGICLFWGDFGAPPLP